jgi:hypothetical protein
MFDACFIKKGSEVIASFDEGHLVNVDFVNDLLDRFLVIKDFADRMKDWSDWGRDGASDLGSESVADILFALFIWAKGDEGAASKAIYGKGFGAREDDDRKEVQVAFKHLEERAFSV